MAGDNSFRTTNNLQESKYLDAARLGVLRSGGSKADPKSNATLSCGTPNTARRQIDPNVDLGKLDVCFGGFSPTAMNSESSLAMVEAAESHQAELRAAKRRVAEIEAARTSSVKELCDKDTVWRYVILDGREVRIAGCETSTDILAIPSEIEGLPVVSIAQDGCAFLNSVTKIIVDDNVVDIGACAFRDCVNLEEIDFPANLVAFEIGWVRHCAKITRLKLPGKIDKITSSLFELKNLKVLQFGDCLKSIPPGAFANSKLERIEIDGNNPYLWTDGLAIYTKDHSVLIALAVPKDNYKVDGDCVAIARKGFSSFTGLMDVELPDTLSVIGPFAYSRTGITEFRAPQALQAIGERAFFACSNLKKVWLNNGLKIIGLEAFSETSLLSLSLPATVQEIEYPLATGVDLAYSGEDATFTIERSDSNDEDTLMLDPYGALYRRTPDGLSLIKMMEPECAAYSVLEGTTLIAGSAFAKHPKIETIDLPEGIVEIGDAAFKGAKSLKAVNLPDSCKRIGEEAFLDTNLQKIAIPAGLTRIGAAALITQGAHRAEIEPSLRKIEVSPQNPRFYTSDGLLIERLDNGTDRVIVCTCECEDIAIPPSVTNIAMYAFNGARRIKSLALSDKISAIDVRGLGIDCMIDDIHVDMQEPIEGHASFDFHFPKTARAMQQLRLEFGSANFINVASIFDHYDASITNRNGFEGLDQQLDAYDQVKRIIDRMADPLFMTPANKNLMTLTLQHHLREFCLDAARHDDKAIIAALLDLGFIDGDNISDVIEWVGAIQDASVTNYLLEEKRKRFGGVEIDFEL